MLYLACFPPPCSRRLLLTSLFCFFVWTSVHPLISSLSLAPLSFLPSSKRYSVSLAFACGGPNLPPCSSSASAGASAAALLAASAAPFIAVYTACAPGSGALPRFSAGGFSPASVPMDTVTASGASGGAGVRVEFAGCFVQSVAPATAAPTVQALVPFSASTLVLAAGLQQNATSGLARGAFLIKSIVPPVLLTPALVGVGGTTLAYGEVNGTRVPVPVPIASAALEVTACSPGDTYYITGLSPPLLRRGQLGGTVVDVMLCKPLPIDAQNLTATFLNKPVALSLVLSSLGLRYTFVAPAFPYDELFERGVDPATVVGEVQMRFTLPADDKSGGPRRNISTLSGARMRFQDDSIVSFPSRVRSSKKGARVVAAVGFGKQATFDPVRTSLLLLPSLLPSPSVSSRS